MNKFYKITSQHSEYYAGSIITKTGSTKLVLDGAKYNCVEISPPNNDLNLIGDKSDCFINQHFPNNKQTDGKDILTAMIYTMKYLYGTCKIQLTDIVNQTFENDKNGVDLSSVYIVFSRQTWYEKWFGAYLENEGSRIAYNNALKAMFANDSKMSIVSFKTFLESYQIKQTSFNKIITIYNESRTYAEFFDKLKERFENERQVDKMYNVISPWINDFVRDVLNLGFIREKRWIIPCQNVDTSGFTIEQLDNDPYNGKYAWITKKPQTGGKGLLKKLSNADKKSYKNPIWIGWKDIKFNEYENKDAKYLRQLAKLHMNN